MAVKLNNGENYESINVFLTREKTPIAFQNKFEELVENGMSEEDAEKFIATTPFELELYYEKDFGLWGVESEFVENCTDMVFSPYTGETCTPCEDE